MSITSLSAPVTHCLPVKKWLPAASIALFAIAASPLRAEERNPSWFALPDETVLVVRIPGGEAFIDALRTRTKLGTVLLNSDRLERLTQAIREPSPDEWNTIREVLGRFDLKPEDWRGLFHGDLGAGLTLEPRGERAPLVVVLGWLEPGEELAPRLMAALGTFLAENADGPFPAKRVDLELAGQEVMHIEIPVTELAKSAESAGDDADDSPEKLQREIEKAQHAEARTIEVDRIHLFVSRMGGRIVFATTVPQSDDEVRTKSEAERAAVDWDALTGVEQATAVFGRFLAAHEGAAEPPRLARAAGLEATLPGGTPLFELAADPRPLLPLAQRLGQPKLNAALEVLGAEGVGPIGLRQALDGTALRLGGMISLPAPRAGLLTLIDQPPLEPEPPVWVPASATGYQCLSFDIEQTYDRVRSLAVELTGDAGRRNFDQIETAAKTYLQIDWNDLLSSLDSRISIVSFPSRLSEAKADGDAADGRAAASPGPGLVQRMGIVVGVKDEAVWNKLLELASRFAQAGAARGLKAVEEQGFRGYRIDLDENEVGVFLGQGYLVIGIGPEVSESLLSVLRTTPEGAAAMRTSGLVERGRALVAPRPCLAYGLEDAGASVKITRRVLESLLDASLGDGLGAASPSGFTARTTASNESELISKLKALLPGDDELEGVMGASVSQWVATDEGLVIESAVELPSP